jgi:Outer membrane lipoprotein-sorting protein
MTRSGLMLAVSWSLVLVAAPVQSARAEDKGKEIAFKVDKAYSGYKGEESDIELELISADGQKVTRKMHSKVQESGRDERGLATITWPADLKGIRLLSWSYRGKDDDQWLYLPSVQRVKRISARGKTGSFLGSEFAYEDLVNIFWVEKFKHKFVRDQKVGARDTWVVERYPTATESGYSKQLAWIDKEYLVPLRIDFYDRKGQLLKSSRMKSITKYGSKWRADRVEMVNHQTGKKSNVVFKSRSLGKTFSDEEFAPGKLGD